MAFNFGGAGNALMGGTAGGGVGGLVQGKDLEVIQTEGLGFLSIAGDAKVQLTSKWSPAPAPRASLLSIASRKGLVAAAGPDAVHLATTESVRKAFEGEKNGDSEVRPFNPQAKVPLPIRISQLAFTADEQYLILSAETGGGLAVYESAFELSTNGETLRALVPNPMPESANLCAIVTNNGSLFMANLAERKLVSGPSGPALRTQVSCAAWSTKGKQLVAGMADGSIYQMTADGVEKGHIPKPPNLGDYHVASVAWLENHVFLAIHNPTSGQEPSVFHIITRQQPLSGSPTFTFQKLTDPVEPFMSEKVPHHSILRLKDFPPNLQDLLFVSSTANESVGLLSRSKTPLASDKPAEAITNVFTTTELADDSKRAQLPMSEDLNETYPIGAALDLSSKDKVYKPIPADEMEYSPGPLPGLWLLNNEGVLAAWWFVYNESIRSGTTYPGIASGDAVAPAFAAAAPAPPAPSAFGTPLSKAPAFGSPSTSTPAFGGPSTLGAKASPWSAAASPATAPAFGSSPFGAKPATAAPTAPAFGGSAFGAKPAAPAFGQSSALGLGAKVSPWASGSTAAATPAFGQSGFSSSPASSGKIFGSGTTAAPAAGGFASFASKGGFAALGGASGGTSIFGSKPGGPLQSSAPEVSMDTDTAFPPPTVKTDKPALGSSPFVLGTTFKADPSTAHDNEKPKEEKGKPLFGSAFGGLLDEASKQPVAPPSKDEDMVSTTPPPVQAAPKSIFNQESTTPTTTPAPQKFDFKSVAPSGGTNLFGSKPAAGGVSSIFGAAKPATTGLFGSKPATSIFGTPKVKQETEAKADLSKVSEAPLPPDTTNSKPVVKGEEAPLPPDFLSKPSKKEEPAALKKSQEPAPEAAPLPPEPVSTTPKPEAKETRALVAEEAPLPPDFLAKPPSKPAATLPAVPDSAGEEGLSEEEVSEGEEEEEEEGEEAEEGEEGEYESEVGSEGSGVDVAKDLSPTIGFGGQTPGVTPQSSFGGMGGSTFSTISRTEAEQSRPLFGEISRNAPPLFPKAVPVPQSPRSPSPVRGAPRNGFLRPKETTRSFSAPGVASQLLGRKAAPVPSSLKFSTGQRPPVDPNVQAQRKLAEKIRAEEHVLVDPEDEGIQQILQSELEPTLQMHEFLAVDSKLEMLRTAGQEVPSACETLWRDVNRMIDRLGLNSRSLQSFILGHETQFKEGGRHKEDLENADDWVLIEARELGAVVEGELAQSLQKGRIQDVEAAEASIKSLAKDLAKLRAKEEDIRKTIASHVDPAQRSAAKSLPLSAEQATQQNELRRSYAAFSKLLAETEEALTLLKARLASAGAAAGKTPAPTVDAIIRTINKMTTMAEKRSGDIDVLEAQMRRLRLGSAGPPNTPGGGGASRSREASPFVTPQHRRSALISPERGSGSGGGALRESLASSGASYAGRSGGGTPSPRKKVSMYSEEEKRELRAREARRKAVLGMLRASLAKAGPNVSRLRDDD
ncbi:cd9b819e-1b2b-4a8a-ad87-9d284fbf9ba0 [Thermothielavioides terrestris]|uniref:Cd9b819e-1b2b-4a8a-ad87-9d284fbf9ba0 n=1 Tax=Thermothielavioides terrestris TaxID=2587410 RepID=A0A3S4EX25_9PEZI|nr:cd9b819e-1b2b-4a8a-ad87-9d284fbf9ba0 [Thermothielavioides terrestris]